VVRPVTVFEPEDRRYVENNLFCSSCGNTHQFSIDLKLRHQVEGLTSGLSVNLEEHQARKVFQAIQTNLERMVDRSIENALGIFKCANCDNGELDFHERLLEICLWTGCPGCWWCGEWMDEEEVIELCSECIKSKQGQIDEDDCFNVCPHFDFGLDEVRRHYGLTFKKLKSDLGY